MATKSSSGKLIAMIVVALIGAIAAYGYFNQATVLHTDEAKAAAQAPVQPDASVLAVKPTDMVLGDPNALVTIVEYMSLSCTHCAHFHEDVLPKLTEEFLTTGKAKLVLRHFPLNAPALSGTKLVECAGADGKERTSFVKVLFDMQPKWAFDESYLKNLKQIALVGGIDSATFDSCMADKALENRILADRQEATEKLGVDSTPFFFINGTKFTGDRDIDGLRTAINDALKTRTGAQPDAKDDAPNK